MNLPPLCDVDGLDDPGDLVDEGDGSGDVVEHVHVADLFPRHGHILHQLQNRMRHVLQSSAIKYGIWVKAIKHLHRF